MLFTEYYFQSPINKWSDTLVKIYKKIWFKWISVQYTQELSFLNPLSPQDQGSLGSTPEKVEIILWKWKTQWLKNDIFGSFYVYQALQYIRNKIMTVNIHIMIIHQRSSMETYHSTSIYICYPGLRNLTICVRHGKRLRHIPSEWIVNVFEMKTVCQYIAERINSYKLSHGIFTCALLFQNCNIIQMNS